MQDRGFAGAAMCLPHVHQELYLRLGENSDSQSEQIKERWRSVVLGVRSLSNGDRGRVMDMKRNAVTYGKKGDAVNNIQTHIGEILQHSCVLGEITCQLLSNIYAYLGMIDPNSEKNTTAKQIVERVAERAA